MTAETSYPIPDAELDFELVRKAAGPGGQNVNKVATAVRLRWNLTATTAIAEDVKLRLAKLAGRRLTQDGVVVITAQRHRTQERNRQDALERLADLVARASVPPVPRRATKPSRRAVQRRITAKKQRGARKAERQTPGEE